MRCSTPLVPLLALLLTLLQLPAALPAVTVSPTPQALSRVPELSNDLSNFGRSISASGDWMAVGAPNADSPGGAVQSGGVYLYRRARSGSWLLQTTLHYPADLLQAQYPDIAPRLTSLRPTGFGSSVALAGDLLVVGVPGWSPKYGEPLRFGVGGLAYRHDRGGIFFYRRTGARTWELEHLDTLREEHEMYW
jgi:hypothetical protein